MAETLVMYKALAYGITVLGILVCVEGAWHALSKCGNLMCLAVQDNQFQDTDGVLYTLDSYGYVDRAYVFYDYPPADVTNCWQPPRHNFGVCCPFGFSAGKVKEGYVCVPMKRESQEDLDLPHKMCPPITFKKLIAGLDWPIKWPGGATGMF